jgi:glutaminyl-peptide cyclotransferase
VTMIAAAGVSGMATVAFVLALLLSSAGCSSSGHPSGNTSAAGSPDALRSSSAPSAAPGAGGASPQAGRDDAAPPADKTGGFDGARAFEHVARQVAFGPRPAGSAALRGTQAYIKEQLAAFGCAVEEDNFTGQTPIGPLAMKNIIAKIPSSSRGIVLLLTHYDTLRLDRFVGANDSGSSTGVMLEMARLYCGSSPAKKLPALSVWIAFLDGEEAQVVEHGVAQWTDTDSVYGSRELAARLALSGDLPRVKAVLLADMIGGRDLDLKRESNSTQWLVNLVWSTAARLGYRKNFLVSELAVQDDHLPFLRRGVPAVDLIDLDYPPWHTPDDTLDKVSPRSLAIIGHVLVETLPQIEKRAK